MIDPDTMPARPADQHLLMERLANQKVTVHEAQAIISSAEAHRDFVAALCAGTPYAARKPAKNRPPYARPAKPGDAGPRP